MRKFACALAAAASLLSACSEKSDSDTAAAPQATAPAYEKIVFHTVPASLRRLQRRKPDGLRHGKHGQMHDRSRACRLRPQ